MKRFIQLALLNKCNLIGLVTVVLLLSSFVSSFGKETQYRFGFSRTGKVFNWTHSFNIGESIGKRLSISGSSQIKSTLTKSAKMPNRWQDGNSANFSISYPYSEKVTLGVNATLSKSSDNLYYKEPIRTGSFRSSLSYKPFDSLSLSQSVGQSFDRRLGRGESGLSYSLRTSFTPSPVKLRLFNGASLPQGLNISLNFGKSGNTLRRKDLNTSLGGTLGYHLTDKIKTNVSFSEGYHEQGYYSSIKDMVLIRSSKSNSINTSLDLKPKPDLGLNCQMRYSYSEVRDPASDIPESPKYGTNNEGVNLEFTSDLSAKPFGTDFSYGIRYQWGDNDYRRYSLDKRTRGLSMKSSLHFNITEASSASLSGLISKFTTDTPDPGEVNDRDDFKSNLSMTYTRKLQDNLKLTVSGSTDHNHTVYIESDRSANNRWTRRYTLSPRIEYRPSDGLSISQNYNLSAHYTEFDFDNPESPRSSISRRMSIANSLNLKLTGRIRVGSGYTLQMSDYGSLYPSGEQLVAEDKTDHSANFSLTYSTTGFSLSPRYSYRSSKTWGYGRSRKLSNESAYQTFSLNISYGKLNLVGTRTIRQSRGQKRYTNDVISVNYNHTF